MKSIKYGCIGHPIGHSFSEKLHHLLGNDDYSLLDVAPENLKAFLLQRDFLGINVTIPHKQSVIPYLDELSQTAREIGAVNTIVNRGGRLYGDNTDFIGFDGMCRFYGVDFRDKTVAVLGSGGASKMVQSYLKDKAKAVFVVSRTPNNQQISYEELNCRKVQILVNTTPVGMFPNILASPVDIAKINGVECVLDLVYTPLKTQLMLDAEKMSIKAYGGLYMLVSQGIASSILFGFPKADTNAVYEKIRDAQTNTVLVGMPGVGKTTAGKRLAEKTGKAFYDTDEEIEKTVKMSCGDYLRTYGEPTFRQVEKEVITRLSSVTGAVIATGGGAVLDFENVTHLQRNGEIVWLDCPLQPTSLNESRPLSQTAEAWQKLYEIRSPLYRNCAHRVLHDLTEL